MRNGPAGDGRRKRAPSWLRVLLSRRSRGRRLRSRRQDCVRLTSSQNVRGRPHARLAPSTPSIGHRVCGRMVGPGPIHFALSFSAESLSCLTYVGRRQRWIRPLMSVHSMHRPVDVHTSSTHSMMAVARQSYRILQQAPMISQSVKISPSIIPRTSTSLRSK